MKVSYHAQQRREAPYGIIRKEVTNGIEITIDLARTLLDRADNRRFKENQDKFVIRKDLLGMYILTEKEGDNWIVVTHIDMSDVFRQNLLKKLFPRALEGELKELNRNMSISNAILINYSLEQISQIKSQAETEAERFLDTFSFPCAFQFEITFENEEHVFQVSKSGLYKATKLAMVS